MEYLIRENRIAWIFYQNLTCPRQLNDRTTGEKERERRRTRNKRRGVTSRLISFATFRQAAVIKGHKNRQGGNFFQAWLAPQDSRHTCCPPRTQAPKGPQGARSYRVRFLELQGNFTLLLDDIATDDEGRKEGRVSRERENRGLCVCVWSDIFARKGTRRWHVVGGNWCHWATWLARVLAAGYGHLRSTFVCIFRRMDRFQNLGSLGNNAEYPRANRRFALFLNHVSLCDLIISTPFAGICLQSFRTKFVKIRLDSKRVFESLEIDERSLERWQV